MPVNEDINLDNPDGITSEDIERMEDEADRLEEIAKRAQDAKDKIEDASEPLKGLNFSQLNIMENAFSGDGSTGADGTSEGSAGKISEMSTQDLMKVIRELMEQQEDHKATIEVHKKDIDYAKKERDQMMKQIQSVEGNISNGFSQFTGLTGNPKSFLRGKGMAFIGKLGVAGAVANFAIQMAERMYNEVIKEVKSWYGDGGSHDVRKDVLNHLLQTANLQHMIAVGRGEVYFTADTAEILRQGVPQKDSTNTRERVNGHKQYQQEFDR